MAAKFVAGWRGLRRFLRDRVAALRETPVTGQYRTLSDYRLIAKLGGGGMAEAYLGVRAGFEKLYVLKVLRSDVGERDKADLVSMFQDEARLAARLNHHHIVQSHDMGCDDGHHFIVMDYLEGQPLSVLQDRWMDDSDCFPLPMRLFVIGQLLEGLDYAHNLVDYDGRHLRIVHRDVSPQNIFVTYDGSTKLLDFGIAKTERTQKTRAGIVKGKVPYMAPEQVRAAELDLRADIFSAGVVLWECIANRPFHTEHNEYDILKRLAEGNFPRLRDAVPDVSPLLERVVSRALAFNREDRYPDARTFREELLQFPGLRELSSQDIAKRMRSLFAENRKAIAEAIRNAISPGTAPDQLDSRAEPETQTALPFLPTAHSRSRGSVSAAAPHTAVVAAPRLSTPSGAPTTASAAIGAPTAATSAARIEHTGSLSTSSTSAPPSAAANRGLPRLVFIAGAAAVVVTTLGVASLRAPSPHSRLEANVPASVPQPPVAPPLLKQSEHAASVQLAQPAQPRGQPRDARELRQPEQQPGTAHPAASHEAASPASVQLSVSVVPSTATILLDGKPLTRNPESRPRDALTHTLKVSAPGYREYTESFVFDKDLVRTVTLVRAATAGSRGGTGNATRSPLSPSPEPSWVTPRLPAPSKASAPASERR